MKGPDHFTRFHQPDRNVSKLVNPSFGKSIMACAFLACALVGKAHAAAPSDLLLDNTSVAENRAVGTLVGTLTAADPDMGDSHTFTLESGLPGCDGSDNAFFRIRGSELQVGGLLDYEKQTEYAICVRATDSGNENYEKAFAISVADETAFIESKLTAGDGLQGDSFGNSVAIDGDILVVGAYVDDDHGTYSGSAYVFVKPAGGWGNGSQAESAKLTASDGAAWDYFGTSVAISGDVAFVGVRGHATFTGAVYVFVKPAGGWSGALTESAKLTASDGETADWLGKSMAIKDDILVVGANGDDENGSESGSAYVYVKPPGGWGSASQTESAKLIPGDGANHDSFGVSVAISDDIIVVGANHDDDNGDNSGSAYVFVKPVGGWNGTPAENAKLVPSDAATGDYFGASVATSDDVIIVGAYGDNRYSGSAYVFVKPAGGWTGALPEDAKLIAGDGAAGDFFGESVAMSGGQVLIGASRNDELGSDRGAAYLFHEPAGGWSNALTESAKLLAGYGSNYNKLGASVVISGGVAVVGAPSNYGSGAARLFTNVQEDDLMMSVAVKGSSATPVGIAPSGINCGAACDVSLPRNTVVTLTGAPDAGEMLSWLGSDSITCEPSDTVCQFTLTEAATITVRYEAPEIWAGAPTTFNKEDYADWTLEANQDRLNDQVWLTRQNSQGVFNIRNADGYGSDRNAPSGTWWSDGSVANWESLSFQTWYDWHGGTPPDKVGQPAVLWLVEENIMMDITMTAWTENAAGGGFGYVRSTPEYLAKAIAILAILAGLEPAVPANEIRDINGNGRLDTPDAVCYIQKEAGLK